MRLLNVLLLLLGSVLASSAHALDLAEVKAKGVLRVAVYRDFPPFFADGKGISADLAKALAGKLGVSAAVMPFDADESADDDLRNMVWKGHYLGYGPADVMLHVPVDRQFMERNEQVKIFAPYFREKIEVVRDTARVPTFDSMDALRGQLVGVENATLAHTMLIGAEGGRLREQVRHYRSTYAALDDLKAGKLAAVMGLHSEIEAGSAGAPQLERSAPLLPGLPRNGWVLGLAVKADYEDLARALQQAMNELDQEGRLTEIFKQHGVSRFAP